MSNILIIDDEKAIRKTLSEILSYEGYKIDEAGDGEEGLKKVREKEYDVVLCDIKMPKIDGIEFLEKAKEANPDIPIIMISGHGTIETAVEAVKKGAYDYISKPPDLNRLLITIRNAMDKTTLVAETKVLKRKVSKVQEFHDTDKEGHAIDRSVVQLEDSGSKERLTLVKDMPARTAASFAMLTSADGATTIKVKQGDTFKWPGEDAASYKVIDLREDQVVLQQVEKR